MRGSIPLDEMSGFITGRQAHEDRVAQVGEPNEPSTGWRSHATRRYRHARAEDQPSSSGDHAKHVPRAELKGINRGLDPERTEGGERTPKAIDHDGTKGLETIELELRIALGPRIHSAPNRDQRTRLSRGSIPRQH
jgi:hypothetical protein